MTITRPPMGWNSWNTFGKNISEKLIMETADMMVKDGFLDCGYNYLVIDDCWSCMERDEEGRLQADKNIFPHGMKYVADYVHSKGLKFGMYSCVGTKTCAGYPGSYHHEFIDADTFAKWGVDYLKYDYCFKTEDPGYNLYRKMGLALENCGRDILFSACNWGADGSFAWIKTTGADIWRSTEDIIDSWGSIKKLFLMQKNLQATNGHGCFNDMDMLIVGMNGKGNVAYATEALTTYDEYVTHFSAWALLGSPLMMGCDMRALDDKAREILMNKDIIAINQDVAGRQPYLTDSSKDEQFVYVRHLDGGDLAIGMFNVGDEPADVSFSLDELSLDESCNKTLHLKDLWNKEEFDLLGRNLQAAIMPHSCKVYRASVIDVK